MARNKMADLNDHLFAQLERLGDEKIKPEQMELEAQRASAITKVSGQLIKSFQTQISALKLLSEGSVGPNDMPETFGLNQIKQIT